VFARQDGEHETDARMDRAGKIALALGGAALLASPATAGVLALSARRSALRGTIAYGSFHSQALAGPDHYAIYLPPGYAAGTTRYPVVYFLHGLPAGPDAYRQIGIVVRAVEQAGRQAIVVGAEGARTGDTDPEWRDWGQGRNWETATAVELPRVIDSRYRTVATRAGRLLVGVSAGGYGATLIANHHPGTYRVIESWSGYFHATDPTGTRALDLGSTGANDWASFARQIPLLHKRFSPWWQSTYYGFYVGTNDARFRAENERIARLFRTYHVPHVSFFLYSGAHSWSLWQEHAPTWIGGGLRVAAQPRP
jgi:S-formylglutathione hydrolase FrmB